MPSSIASSLSTRALSWVDNDDSVNCRSSAQGLVDNQLETIACSRHKVDRRCVEFGRSDTCRATALHRSSFLDCFRARVDGDSVARRSRSEDENHLSGPWDVLILPPRERIESELLSRHSGGPAKLPHLLSTSP